MQWSYVELLRHLLEELLEALIHLIRKTKLEWLDNLQPRISASERSGPRLSVVYKPVVHKPIVHKHVVHKTCPRSILANTTVKGELGVANFIDNFFKQAPLPDTCGCAPLPGCTPRYRCHYGAEPILPHSMSYSSLQNQLPPQSA